MNQIDNNLIKCQSTLFRSARLLCRSISLLQNQISGMVKIRQKYVVEKNLEDIRWISGVLKISGGYFAIRILGFMLLRAIMPRIIFATTQFIKKRKR